MKNEKQSKQDLKQRSLQDLKSKYLKNLKEAENGKYFSSDQYDEWFEEFRTELPITRKKKVDYFEVPVSFDIETTSFYQEEDGIERKAAIMYIWMLSINGKVIIGRNWTEFMTVITAVSVELGLHPGKKELICYVQNLGFEFQFIKDRLKFVETFAMDLRRPLYAKCDLGILFKCSQFLSGTSLAEIGKDLTKYKVRKMEGDLDYSLIRNELTYLTDEEMQYCINDVLVLQSYIWEKMELDGSITKIPLTKTGYVRKLCRNNCLYGGNSTHKGEDVGRKYTSYRALMRRTQLTTEEYKHSRRTYQGGFTHGNSFYTDKLIEGQIHSFDFTSSYPYTLVAEKFPMSRKSDVDIPDLDELHRQINCYWCMFDVELTGVVAKFPYEHYISRSRCVALTGETIDNGRVVEADRLLTSCTGEDWDIIEKTYEFKTITIYNFKRYALGYLPTDFVRTVLELYRGKTELKGVHSDDGHIEAQYAMMKANLNSLYGMCVTSIDKDVCSYEDAEWLATKPDLDEAITKYNESKTRFISYLWGVACTSYARHNLWTAILECGKDYIYADTDSVKIIKYEDHKDYFERYNNLVDYKLKLACSHHHFPVEWTRPKTINGKEKMIGVWDDDGTYVRFKFLGAKRYLCEDAEGGIHLTVAGVSKHNAARYLIAKYKTSDKIFKAFTDELSVPAEYEDDGGIFCASGKQTHTYIDREIDGFLTDYQGHTAHYNELSCVHLEATDYNLSLADEYIRFLSTIQTYTI